jgi:hypothetical protein
MRRTGAATLAMVLHAATTGAQAQTILTYLNAPPAGSPITAPPRLALSLGGAPRPAVMDTGSTGIVVSAAAIPDLAALPALGEGTLTYSSSGRIMRGTWVRTAATMRGANGAAVTTAPIPVLAVTRVDCLRTARNCTPGPAGPGIAMIGIGFGRQGDHQADSTPDRNPFLMPTAGGRGYVVTRTNVQVGLTQDARRGFATVRLARSPSWPDWAQAPACVSVNAAAPTCGVALMDTGVTTMYLSVPQAAGAPDLRAGTLLRFDLPDAIAPVASYTLRTGDRTDPLAPDRIVLVPRPTAFVNTSVRFLNGFDYLYDADQGLVGYRPRGPD